MVRSDMGMPGGNSAFRGVGREVPRDDCHVRHRAGYPRAPWMTFWFCITGSSELSAIGELSLWLAGKPPGADAAPCLQARALFLVELGVRLRPIGAAFWTLSARPPKVCPIGLALTCGHARRVRSRLSGQGHST